MKLMLLALKNYLSGFKQLLSPDQVSFSLFGNLCADQD